jgi:TolB-like protein/class 3 adenylate cyclase/Tfp pilus assembly protein PilF
MKEPVQRRLAAIFAADVAGYSRLMGADEEGTLERLKAHRRLLIDPKTAEHRGRIVKTTGDGMLVEFPSVVDAVRCAAEVQRGMVDRNAELAEDKQIIFRVGVNLGDVIIEGDDIFGDGVNVAARLEALAEPGGICISRVVRDQIRDKLPYPFEDMGEQSVKNIARPVRAYAMNAAAVASTPLVPARAQPGPARRSAIPARAVVAVALVAVVGIGLGAWWVWPHAGSSPTSVQAPASSQSSPAVTGAAAKPAPRLSIVVLPFENLSKDPDQEYFADGVTDDLTTDLSRIANSFVIARTTAFAYKGKAVDVKQIGKELGVRYALEGSVRRVGQQVQANVQLIDTETGAHVWADRFDADRSDLARAQDQIVAQLARSLNLELLEAVARRIEQRKPINPDASDFVMRGWAWFYRPTTTASLGEAQRAFERALEIDPQSVDAKIGLAWIVTEYVAEGRSHVVNGVSIPREQDMTRGDQLLFDVLERDQDQPKAYVALGRLRRLQGRLIESKIELEKAVALDRNNAIAILQLGITLLYLGQPEAALPHLEDALQLNPHQTQNVWYNYFWLGYCHLLLGQTDQAIDYFRKSYAANPRFPPLFLAAALGLRGDVDEAKALLAESLKLKPELNSLAALAKGPNWNASPQFAALREKTVDVGLRRAGLPDK